MHWKKRLQKHGLGTKSTNVVRASGGWTAPRTNGGHSRLGGQVGGLKVRSCDVRRFAPVLGGQVGGLKVRSCDV